MISPIKLYCKLLSQFGKLPIRCSDRAAGYDLYSPKNVTVMARKSALIPLDVAVKVPDGYYGQIASRSGLAAKNAIYACAGVIDADYRGNVAVLLHNNSDTDFAVKVGDRIAQLILIKITTPDVCEVDELDDTARGEGGFGSTGVGDELPIKDTSRL